MHRPRVGVSELGEVFLEAAVAMSAILFFVCFQSESFNGSKSESLSSNLQEHRNVHVEAVLYLHRSKESCLLSIMYRGGD